MTGAARPSLVVKRSVTIAGHSTSISLEQPFWQGLGRIAKESGMSVAALLRRIDATRDEAGGVQENLSSAIRVFVLRHFAAEAGVDLGADLAD